MTQLELAKKAIETIGWHSFHCRVYGTEGGKCSNGWNILMTQIMGITCFLSTHKDFVESL